jgi:hypothetical protein
MGVTLLQFSNFNVLSRNIALPMGVAPEAIVEKGFFKYRLKR